MRSAVADPVVLVLLLLIGGLWIGMVRRRLGAALLVAGVVVLYLFANPFVGARLARLAEAPFETTSAVARPPQAIVILSAGVYRAAPEYAGDTVDALTLERMRYGARLHRQTGLPILVTGGVLHKATRPVAEAMREVLVEEWSVPVRWVEGQALTTRENAERSAAMLKSEGLDAVYLVTHAVHMPRSQDAFEQVGLVVTPAPTGFAIIDPGVSPRDLVPQTTTLVRSFYALHELIGRLWYRIAHAAR